MVSFAAPLWLFGLATLPIIWWLHRLRSRGPEVTVTALFLWRLATPPDGSGGRRAKAETSWWLRALMMTSLVLALGSPQWLGGVPRVTVWVDDSLSMFTWEGDATRMELGIDKLTAALRIHNANEALVHSLSSPGVSLALTNDQTDRWTERLRAWLSTPRREPRPPAAVEMTQDSEHWLVSDGASAGLAEWLQAAPVTRVLAVGDKRANAAVTTLALRPSLRAREILKGLVVVTNPGPEPLNPDLVLRLPGQELLRKPLPLSPVASETVEFELPVGSQGPLRAELVPADALALDDKLSVPVPAPIAVRLQGNCGRYLNTALSTHPHLRIVGAGQDHEAAIACTTAHSLGIKPTLLFHAPGVTRPVPDTPYWSKHAGLLTQLSLAPEWLYAYPPRTAPAASLPLLTVAETPLINYGTAEPAWIEVLLDMEAPSFAQRPEYLALIDGLLARLLRRPLLDPLNRAARSPAPSRIVPTNLRASSRPDAGDAQTATDLGSHFIGLAGLLLAIDFWRLYIRRHPLRQ